MSLVQLLLHKDAYARDLSVLLEREGCFEVIRADAPDFGRGGVIVADHMAVSEHPALLDHPERLIMITPNDQQLLETVWRHNIRAVVFDTDSPSTALLAILGSGIGRGGRSLLPTPPKLVVLDSGTAASVRCGNLR